MMHMMSSNIACFLFILDCREMQIYGLIPDLFLHLNFLDFMADLAHKLSHFRVSSQAKCASFGKRNCFGRTSEATISEHVGVSCRQEPTF